MTNNESKDLIEVNPEVLKNISQADRNDWGYETYVSLGLEATQIKGYSQWIIGMLASEVFTKWGMDEDYAKELHISVGSLQQYRRVYTQLSKQGYIPDGYFPWGVLQIATNYTPEDPTKTLEELQDKGVATIEGAYRHVKEKQTGKLIPKKPSLRLSWDKNRNKWKIVIKPQDIPEIDWSDIKKQLLEYFSNL